ncbi:hypothetical protein EJ05DRAFT_326535 [Pseudovirgaria hyperparasitica]|uniref:Uncharacterized protein n=1 Tax=Pseudovirgaria hyperparasitica TaxID=470096 RepID=A0A6A6WA68_9PEZI|nr:uncharacterized protein EJ05DRAFT_326535 [Pseudovirgaria hyperparasitica]KAF2758924.1 hypothetical protein EJ05DRAFT_326535 [Pseudovirgaria hyperparasitica]
MPAAAEYKQPHVEDYHSDDGGTPQANVTAKRSKSSNLQETAKDAPADIISDAATDSGYSSRTAATVSSADSGGRSQPPSRSSRAVPPAAAESTAAEPPRKKSSTKDRSDKKTEKTKLTEKKSERTKEKSRPVVVNQTRPRTDSRARKVDLQRADDYREEGNRPVRRQQPAPIHTSHQSYSRQPSPESVRSPYHVYHPQSPSYSRTNSTYSDPMVQPAHTTHRRSSSVSRPRPASYHSADGPLYGQYGRLPTVDHQPAVHGPPPSSSAYANVARPQYMPTSTSYSRTPHHTGYFPQMQQPSHLSYASQPPDSTYSTRGNSRPTSMYTPALISQSMTPGPPTPYSRSPAPSARYGPLGPSPQIQPNPPAYSSRAHPSTSDYEDDDDDEDDDDVGMQELQTQMSRVQMDRMQMDRVQMPPPRRPSIRQKPELPAIDYYSKSPAPPIMEVSASSRRRQSQSASSRTYTDSTRSSKRYYDEDRYAPPPSQKYDGRRRSIPVEFSDEETFPFEDERRPSVRRRTRTENDMSRLERAAREHQKDPERGEQVHTSDALLRDKIANNSSRRIERAPSDAKSQVSRRSTMTKATNGINLHVAGNDDFNISITGDMNGQTLQVAPSADGGAMITIGGKQYHDTGRSERSSRSRGLSSAGKSSRSSQKESRVGHTSRRDPTWF